MSGHPAYAWGNPPTLRRSSFPQRALRPAGGPIPKHAWGCAPRPPNAQAAAGYELDFSANAEKSIRTAPQIRSQGACGAFYFGYSRDQIKNQPYKRRRVGRNLRLSRTDPTLCFGQPSPLRCILLSPQGLATLRGPRRSRSGRAFRCVGVLGFTPSRFWALLASQKCHPAGRRTN